MSFLWLFGWVGFLSLLLNARAMFSLVFNHTVWHLLDMVWDWKCVRLISPFFLEVDLLVFQKAPLHQILSLSLAHMHARMHVHTHRDSYSYLCGVFPLILFYIQSLKTNLCITSIHTLSLKSLPWNLMTHLWSSAFWPHSGGQTSQFEWTL